MSYGGSASAAALKYSISSTIHLTKGRPRIYIKKDQVEFLRAIIKPHMHSSMYYKVG